MKVYEIICEIKKERQNQIKKWGNRKWKPVEHIGILMEEVGEVAREIVDDYFLDWDTKENYKKELIQAGAVIFNMLENIE